GCGCRSDVRQNPRGRHDALAGDADAELSDQRDRAAAYRLAESEKSQRVDARSTDEIWHGQRAPGILGVQRQGLAGEAVFDAGCRAGTDSHYRLSQGLVAGP